MDQEKAEILAALKDRRQEELEAEIRWYKSAQDRYAKRIEEMYRLACPECRRKFDGGEK